MNSIRRFGCAVVALVGIAAAAAEPPGDAAGEMPIFRENARILFQGDSITDGNRGRSADPNHILGHGYQFIIAAKYGGRLSARYPTFFQRGVSGNPLAYSQQRCDKDTITAKLYRLCILSGVIYVY